MWLYAPKSTNHTLFDAEALVEACAIIDCALCLITKHSEPVVIVRIRDVVHGHSAAIVVVGVGSVICELLALFIVAMFSTVPTFRWVVTPGWSGVITLLGVEKAACVEEITQQSVSVEEPAYGRYETVYAQRERERERGTKSISLTSNSYNNEQPTFTKAYKVTLYSDSLRATALYANYRNGPNLGYQRG